MKKKNLILIFVLILVVITIVAVGCGVKTPPDNDLPSGSITTPSGDVNTPSSGDQMPDGNPDEWDDGVDYTEIYLTNGNGTITGLTDYGNTLSALIIPVKVGTKAVKAIAQSAFSGNYNLTSVTFAPTENPIVINDLAFYNCINLKSAQLSAGVNSVSSKAFYACESLETISVDEANETYIGEGNCLIESQSKTLIAGCKTSRIPSWVTAIGSYSFARQSKLQAIEIPNGVKTIGDSAFYYCQALESLVIPASVESIGAYAFDSCKNIASLTFDEHSNLTLINEWAFQNCSSIKSVTFPKSLKTLAKKGSFTGCASLEEVNLHDEMTAIGYEEFKNCSSLKKIVIPASITTMGGYVFYGCTGLTIYCEATEQPSGFTAANWNYGYFSGRNMVIGGYNRLPTVWDCNNNEIDSNGYINYYTHDGVHYALKNGIATLARQAGSIEILDIKPSIAYSGVVYEVTQILDGACEGNQCLKEVTVPSCIVSIPDYTFDSCISLESVAIEGNSQMTKIGQLAFYGCVNLKSINIPNSVTWINIKAFANCVSLESIFIPISVRSMGSNLFKGCASMQVIRCEAQQKPDTWIDSWKADDIDIRVEWGCIA